MRKIMGVAVLLAMLLAVSGCDSLTTNFDTTLRTTIQAPVEQTGEVKDGLKDVTLYPFSVMHVLDVQDNDRIKDYLDRIREIEVKSVKCTFTGIPSGETVTELNIAFQPVNVTVSLANLSNGDVVTLDLSHDLLNSISTHLTDNKKITIVISGKATYAPMVLNTLVEVPVKVTAGVLD